MFKRFGIAAVALSLALAPVIAAESVPGTASTTPNAARAQQSNTAIVEKNLNSTTITVPPSSEPQEFHIDVKPLIDGLLPYIISTMGGIIVIIGGILTAWLKQRFNIEIEAKQREAWQQTATNAAGALIAKGAVAVEEGTGRIVIHSEAMADVINTASQRVPAAIKALGITPEQMAQTITAKVPQVLTGSTQAAAVGKA